MGTSLPLPSFSPAKDPAAYPAFKGAISRMAWRVLTQRLTTAGRWFAVISVILGSYGGASTLRSQNYVPAAYIGAVWLIAIIVLMMYRPRVKLTARFASRTSVGEVMPVDLVIEQQSSLRGADLVVMPHNLPLAVDAVPEDGVVLPDMVGGQSTRLRLGLRCTKRGKHVVPGFRVESGFPFGILRARRSFHEPQSIIAYPSFRPLARLKLPAGRRYQPGGVALASQLGESFEYLGNREYRPGDNVRDIDWRATARVQRLIVREWVEEYMLRVAVILDTHVPKKSTRQQGESFERAVSVAAAVSDYMARQDYLVDLFAAGPNLYHLTAGRSLAYLEQILDILACVEANPNEPFATIEPQLAELLSRISTVICVFLDWDDPRREFVKRLHVSGVAVKVIILRDGPCMFDPADDARTLGEVPVISKAEFDAGIDEL